jgi:hypothetical protein
MTEPARVLHATLDLMDRQLVDRHDRLCGNVDDLELFRDDEAGDLFVTALLTGPGVLAYRLGAHRIGRWLQRANQRIHDDGHRDRTRIPMELAHQIGPSIIVAMDADELANHDGERWASAHIIEHIPGNDSRAPE